MPLCSFCQWEAEKIVYNGETVHADEIPTEAGLAPGEVCSQCQLRGPSQAEAEARETEDERETERRRLVLALALTWAILTVVIDLTLAAMVGLAAVGIAANDISPLDAFFLATMAAFAVMTLKSAGERLMRR